MAARDYNEGFLDGLEYAFELARSLPAGNQDVATLMEWLEARAHDRGYTFQNAGWRNAK